MHDEVPNLNALIIPVLSSIKSYGGKASNDQIFKALINSGLKAGANHGPSNRSELEYRAAWARSYLKAYGGIQNPTRGVWEITAKGKSISESDVPGIISSVLNESRRENKKKSAAVSVKKAFVKPVANPLQSVSPVDQAKTILELLSKGFLTTDSANKALMRIGGN